MEMRPQIINVKNERKVIVSSSDDELLHVVRSKCIAHFEVVHTELWYELLKTQLKDTKGN